MDKGPSNSINPSSRAKNRVAVNGQMSDPTEMKFGLPQGSGLAPLPFSVYANDLPFPIFQLRGMFANETIMHAWSQTNSADEL